MCGIVGFTGRKQAMPLLLDGLQALEYRGYDSAGIEVVSTEGSLAGARRAGRVAALAEACSPEELAGTTGIAHTRWATHGAPSERNAHPHRDCTGKIAIVHNGIIENFRELKGALEARGHVFRSETDSEVIAHLVEEEWDGTGSLLEAVRGAVSLLEGSWAIAALCADRPEELVCARKGSPLVVAATPDGCYAASDITAIAGTSDTVIQLEDGQLALLSAGGTCEVFDAEGERVEAPSTLAVDWEASAATLGGYPDFMAKEIAEQPEAIRRLLDGRLDERGIVLDELRLTEEELAAMDQVIVVACGTSWHVGLMARDMIEAWAGIPVRVEQASELNYRERILASERTLCVSITQSGETADTLAAARRLRALGCKVFSITNVLGSTAARESDGTLCIKAGPEVCVASTKAYTAQMAGAALLSLRLAQARGALSYEEVAKRFADLEELPRLMEIALGRSREDREAAKAFRGASSALFLGRGMNATTAAEGALKLKEISYLHAEAYAAGEMKHGPIALLEPGFPVVAIVPQDHVHDKTISNIQECIARGATVIAVATDGDEDAAALCGNVLWLPPAPEPFLVPMVAIVHLQMLARFVALDRGCDVDRPRNLAKSVTVE